jgi:uncharacterized protein
MSSRVGNRLIHSISPYLLQHAYNPVDWYEWGDEALQKARSENKPILVSIGYSACHWCHVMEHECFENERVAQVMNQHYVCIKIDREERPDLDAIYMDSVQAMGISGGWPLNVFLTPDARPFFGGTYFPAPKWIDILERLAHAFENAPEQVEESASRLTEFLQKTDSQKYKLYGERIEYSSEKVEKLYKEFASFFDNEQGGMGAAPKFPMPVLYDFLLHYIAYTAQSQSREEAQSHLLFTLDQMHLGGIYDQVGGGFARYSVDNEWFLPHFEKMLYDNAQLIGLYAQAYSLSQEERYKEAVYQTVEFIEREMRSPENGFYSALDADSEGQEGKFYLWTEEQLQRLFTAEDFLLVKAYYHTLPTGNWHEAGSNILFRSQNDEDFAQIYQLSREELAQKVATIKQVLLKEREKRVRPGTDDKILTSWNALTIKGLCQAYQAFGEKRFLDLALQNALFIEQNLRKERELLHSFRNGTARIAGFLEDYAALIEAYVHLYQSCFDEKWLQIAQTDVEYVLENFFDGNENLFFFTSKQASQDLIAKKKETFDNVIPASNSIMAKNLHLLGLLLGKSEWIELSDKMLWQVYPLVESEPRYLANWASLLVCKTQGTAEIAIVGKDALQAAALLQAEFLPNKVVAASTKASELPLLQNRQGEETRLFVCKNYACQLPVKTPDEALALVRKG